MGNVVLVYIITGITLSFASMPKSCLPCYCQPEIQYGGYKGVCSNLNLTFVPRNLTEERTVLLLDGNAIQWLSNEGFSWMKNLVILDLSRNSIRRLNDNVFYGLNKLQYLNLDYNGLFASCDDVFNRKFLLPLTNLIFFSFVRQQHNCSKLASTSVYFGIFFPKSLQSLHIDCFLCIFDKDFLALKHLSLLSFSNKYDHGHCFITYITQSTFQYFPHLKHLNISDCQTSSIQPHALMPLTKLQVLDISVFPLDGNDFELFMNATMALQKSPIQTVTFRNRKMTEMKENTFMFLKNTSITELYFDSELYALVKRNTLRKLPMTLEKLVLTHFQFDSYDVFYELEYHHSISVLDMSGMALPRDYIVCSLDMFPSNLKTFTCNNCRCPDVINPNSEDKEWPALIVKKKNVRKFILSKNNIEYVDLRNTYCQSLEYLDLSDNNLKGIYQDSILPNYTVSYLNLAKNRLDNYLETEYWKLFKKLTQLTFLDISENSISSLPNDIFQYSQNILTINVSNNHLQSFEVLLTGLNQLETLDLSENKLHDLALTTRTAIETLPKASVRLNGNPFVCGCDELDFLKWVQRNPDRVQNPSSLRCRFSSGRYENFESIDKIINDLEKLCKSNILEISISVSVGVCAMAGVIGFLGYRNRWKLKYLYYVGRRGYRRRYDVIENNGNAYLYDAFVSYADEDRRFIIDAMIPELEEKCGLKLCIHHRDFLPGEVIADNIVSAIQNSRKTLIILSPSFLKSNWCEFEYNMARMEGVSRREEIVLVVLYEDVPIKVLPKDMAMMLRRNCYIEYNNDIFDDEVFWYNVLESIKIKRPVD